MQQEMSNNPEQSAPSQQTMTTHRVGSFSYAKPQRGVGSQYQMAGSQERIHISGTDENGFYIPPSRSITRAGTQSALPQVRDPLQAVSDEQIISALGLTPTENGPTDNRRYRAPGSEHALSAREHWAIHWLDLKVIDVQAKTFSRPGFSGVYTMQGSGSEFSIHYSGGVAQARNGTQLRIPAQTYHHGVWDMGRPNKQRQSPVSSTSSQPLVPPVYTPSESPDIGDLRIPRVQSAGPNEPQAKTKLRYVENAPTSPPGNSPTIHPTPVPPELDLPVEPSVEPIVPLGNLPPPPPLDLVPGNSNTPATQRPSTAPPLELLPSTPGSTTPDAGPPSQGSPKPSGPPPLELVPGPMQGSLQGPLFPSSAPWNRPQSAERFSLVTMYDEYYQEWLAEKKRDAEAIEELARRTVIT